MCFLPFAPYSADKENLFIYQELLRLVIISFIAVTSIKLSVTISI